MTAPKGSTKFEFEKDASDGRLVGPDGCHYSTPKHAYHYAFLGLCGCGSPEDAYNFCRGVLQCFDRRWRNDNAPTKGWIAPTEAVATIIKKSPDTAAHVLAHLLTERGLLEHGSSIGGSWLTEWGKQLVDSGPMSENELLDE